MTAGERGNAREPVANPRDAATFPHFGGFWRLIKNIRLGELSVSISGSKGSSGSSKSNWQGLANAEIGACGDGVWRSDPAGSGAKEAEWGVAGSVGDPTAGRRVPRCASPRTRNTLTSGTQVYGVSVTGSCVDVVVDGGGATTTPIGAFPAENESPLCDRLDELDGLVGGVSDPASTSSLDCGTVADGSADGGGCRT